MSTLIFPSLIASSKRTLGLRRGAIDLIRQDDICENRAAAELKRLFSLPEHRDPEDIGGEQIARELDSSKSAVESAGKRMGEGGLADARHVLNEQMAFGEQ